MSQRQQPASSSVNVSGAARPGARFATVRGIWSAYGVYIIFAVLVVLAASISNVFFTWVNIMNVLRQASMIGIVTIGMLLVILTGGIDLSVGSVVALGGIIAAALQTSGSAVVGVVAALAVGIATGACNGLMITKGRVAPFVVTLATMSIVRGVVYTYTGGAVIFIQSSVLRAIGEGYLLGIPVPVIIAAAVVIATDFLVRRMAAGRVVLAVGGNEEAVRLAGIDPHRYKMLAYTLSGFMSALAGVILASRSYAAAPVVGLGWELDAIAGAVIGGASLSGGRGNVPHTVVGILTLAMINNILNLMNVPSYPQQILKGLIIIGAVISRR